MRALYVATDLRDADILQQEVRRAAPKLTFDVCSGTAEARSRTEDSLGYDVMILDSSMPEHEQQQLIEHVRSRQIPLPIVILVGQGTTPSSAIVAAADECITRGPRLAERLAPGLRMAIERYRVVATVSRENERLKRSEARLRLIIEAMPAGVVLVDQSGKIQAMNLAGAALVGTSGPSDVVGRELYSLADHDSIQPLRDLVSRAFDGERGKAGFTCHGPDGLLRPLRIEALCIQKDAQGQGSVLGVLSAATGEIVALPPTMEPNEDAGVDFAFANDQHSEERIALEHALEEMRNEAARLSHEAESERTRVQQVLEELERSRATAAEHHAQKNQIEERHRTAEERIAGLEARIAELDGRGRDAEGAAKTLTAQVEHLTSEAGELRGEREKLQAERHTLQGELARAQKDLETLRGDLAAQARGQAEAMVRAEAAEQEKARVADAAGSTQAAAEAKVKELAGELKSALAKADAQETALKAEIEQVRADAVRVAEALDAQGKERKGAEAALAAARDALQTRVQELEAQHAELESRRQAAVARTAELEEARRAEQAALATATTHETNLQQQLKAARDEAQRAASERDAVKSELAHVHESHRAAEDDASLKASEAARLRADLEGRLQQAQAALDRVQAERQAAQGALDATVAQADGTRGELDQLRADLDRQRAELEQRSAEWQQRGTELQQRDADLSQVRGELDQVRGQLDRVRAEFDQARGELEATRGARDASAREVEDVKAAVAKAATVIDELRQGREAIDARAHAATGELDTLRAEIDATRQRAADLQQTLERERADARDRAAAAERDHPEAMARLHKQVEEAREFQAAAANRAPSERGRRRPGERLGQLASAMANDLHGIVNVMTDDARKLLAELPDGSTVRAQAEQSLQSANRAGQLVRHLLRLSEREARAMSGSDPNTLVRANEPMLRQLAGPDIDLRFELTPGLPAVECDSDELAGLLSTLVVTVRGALPLGGSIRLTTQPPRKDGGRRRNDTSLALAVVAEGYGMVSVPTTVCDEVVTRSGGTFSAQVDLKAGTTTFTAYLPIDQTAEGVTNIA
jgi:PAS domain S-box-containing protein